MRKVVLDLAVSLDGFIEGTNGETDWMLKDSHQVLFNFVIILIKSSNAVLQ